MRGIYELLIYIQQNLIHMQNEKYFNYWNSLNSTNETIPSIFLNYQEMKSKNS